GTDREPNASPASYAPRPSSRATRRGDGADAAPTAGRRKRPGPVAALDGTADRRGAAGHQRRAPADERGRRSRRVGDEQRTDASIPRGGQRRGGGGLLGPGHGPGRLGGARRAERGRPARGGRRRGVRGGGRRPPPPGCPPPSAAAASGTAASGAAATRPARRARGGGI